MIQTSSPDRETTFIALINGSAVRDAQVCTSDDRDPLKDENWYDYDEPEIYLGVFRGTWASALNQAARFAGTSENNIKLVDITNLFSND